MAYTKAFWQMEGSYKPFHEVYQKILDHPNAHSFVGFYGKEMVCQLDIYMVGVDELSWHIPEESHHCGFHLLMAPNDNTVRGLTLALIDAFLQYFFSFSEAEKMYAEPDIRNQKSITLLKNSGFTYLDTITLSYKTAHLYCLSRQQFFSHHKNQNNEKTKEAYSSSS
jgi:RimJ/RimL family protein N-acetyltransferase